MLTFLQLYFIVTSLFLFIYAIQSDKNASYAFGYGIAINIFPIAWVPYFSMDAARIIGIPLAYLPIIAAGFALIKRNKFKISTFSLPLLRLSLVFLLYTFFTGLILHGFTFKNFAYWFAWVLNFIIFFSAITFFSKSNIFLSQKVMKSTGMILVLGSIVGVLRYLSGIAIDSNFMPVVNRNGTVVIIVLFIPLILHLGKSKLLSRKKFIFYLLMVGVGVLLTFSRSGLLGFLLALVLYYSKMNVKGILTMSFLFAVMITIVMSGVLDVFLERIYATTNTFQTLIEGNEFDNSMDDYNRVQLLKSAISIIKNNFWLGTGLGLENYRRAFHEVSYHFHDSKAHNFYLSYFAELGLVGFSLLIFFFRKIYTFLAGLNSKFRFFRVSFLIVAFMMTMNEYILLPEIWFYFGMLAGISFKLKKGRLVL